MLESDTLRTFHLKEMTHLYRISLEFIYKFIYKSIRDIRLLTFVS